jgi:hypothetical protein
MKKIIIISESKQFTQVATEFLKQLREEQPAFLVGCFAHSLNYAELIETSRQPYMRLIVDLVEQDREAVEDNIMLFEYSCHRERNRFRVHEENNKFKLEHLIIESRFADLLIVNERLFTKNNDPKRPEINLQQTLQKAECPILLLPEKLKSVRKLAITYDGRKESMFALKQFSYLFPQLAALPTEIVYLSEEEKDDVPRTELLKEYVSNHFSSVNISKVLINPKKDLAKWAAMHEDVLVIAGSYSRNGLDSIPDSFIDPILEMKQLPVFITHP